ncbi:hypothetical protein F5I97DRAFT_1963877 [Phlebopus sp. FC_14]|nr:hypothetical protein F5I97DRAFT_1963877 [Phlebopus sp. FC_14]
MVKTRISITKCSVGIFVNPRICSWRSDTRITGSACSSYGSSEAIDALTDDEVYTLIQERSDETAIRAPNGSNGFLTDTVWRISQDAVVKATYSPTEVFMMSYVSSHTSIPIPKVRRLLPARASDPDSGAEWIVMDYIPGNTLETEWPRMSMWRRLCAIWLIRRYIRELRRVPVPNRDVPGPFDVSGKSYACRGYYFTEDGSGPFHSYLDMAG